uniref:Uncharacterized protein n=1 Tax=Faecalibaculum rodentium TaxID=1702221 RepID=A0A140DYQ2_9FIRM|nr:hypothetical protein AALO17_26450 [Faecalibaculum rodentium]
MNDDRIRPVPATGACQIRFCVYTSAVWGSSCKWLEPKPLILQTPDTPVDY